jgi:hypothetical protein
LGWPLVPLKNSQDLRGELDLNGTLVYRTVRARANTAVSPPRRATSHSSSPADPSDPYAEDRPFAPPPAGPLRLSLLGQCPGPSPLTVHSTTFRRHAPLLALCHPAPRIPIGLPHPGPFLLTVYSTTFGQCSPCWTLRSSASRAHPGLYYIGAQVKKATNESGW